MEADNAGFYPYAIACIRSRPELSSAASGWFCEKWRVPRAAYRASMADCAAKEGPVPQWYVVLDGERIIAGIGVIENDFHERRDLSPNVCAVYVEEAYRRQGIAGRMLDFVCKDLLSMGIGTLYLVTDHTGFYERYGWAFHCMTRDSETGAPSRMYVHKVR